MRGKLKGLLIAGGAIAVLGGGGAAIAAATGGDDGDGKPITGSALDRAKRVALDQTGGGRVTGTEIRDEEGYYEVEVQRGDGSSVDVHLDRHFNVISGKADSDSAGDEGSDSD
jgi:hypothetical protein